MKLQATTEVFPTVRLKKYDDMANYDMQEVTVHTATGTKTLRYPRLLLSGRLDTDELLRLAVGGTTYSTAEARACLRLVADTLADALARGLSVHVDGLGSFSATLELREGFDRETGHEGETRRNAQAIRLGDIRFKADRSLVQRARAACRPVRTSGQIRRSSTQFSPDERLALARQFIAQHGQMDLAQYCALTGLLKDKASRELRRWEQTPRETGIRGAGRRASKHWVADESAADV